MRINEAKRWNHIIKFFRFINSWRGSNSIFITLVSYNIEVTQTTYSISFLYSIHLYNLIHNLIFYISLKGGINTYYLIHKLLLFQEINPYKSSKIINEMHKVFKTKSWYYWCRTPYIREDQLKWFMSIGGRGIKR